VGAVVDQIPGRSWDGVGRVVGAAVASCMGPHAPAQLLPDRTPGSRTRPWSDSTLPMAANTDQGTR
jgi:hypothetical protein